jgi:hypothetical protein
MHPNGHEFTIVIEGEQTFIYTASNTPHFGRNATEKVSKTVVVRVKDKDKPIMVEVKR